MAREGDVDRLPIYHGLDHPRAKVHQLGGNPQKGKPGISLGRPTPIDRLPYFAVLAILSVLVTRVPPFSLLVAAPGITFMKAVVFVGLPALGAWLLSDMDVQGRPFHVALQTWVSAWMSPSVLAGGYRKVRKQPDSWSLKPIAVLDPNVDIERLHLPLARIAAAGGASASAVAVFLVLSSQNGAHAARAAQGPVGRPSVATVPIEVQRPVRAAVPVTLPAIHHSVPRRKAQPRATATPHRHSRAPGPAASAPSATPPAHISVSAPVPAARPVAPTSAPVARRVAVAAPAPVAAVRVARAVVVVPVHHYVPVQHAAPAPRPAAPARSSSSSGCSLNGVGCQ